ncbi:MAG: hypothetical protein U0791_01875 [Gemmataceae bacterium]
MMPHELLYTSAPRGLKPGSSGFCTVAQTPDLPKDLASQLEGISHYRHLRVDDPAGNPVALSHSILTVGYGVFHVVSRIADSGLDHSGRSNFLAHHVSFDPEQLPDAGPAWLCEQRLFYQKWDRGAGLLPADRAIPNGRSEPRVCKQWMKATGDAGWAGVLAAATNAAEPAYLVYEPGQDVLPLLEEAMALLPPEARWNVTFNTYFTGKAVRTTCQWRCVTADSPEARDAIATRRGVVLRIDQPMNGVPSGPLVEAARTGQTERPAPRRRTVEQSPLPPARTAIEINELPDSEPATPASRPIRTRPHEPEPDLSESAYDMPVAEPRRRSSGKSGIGALILGMLLGSLLLMAAFSLVELVSEDWLFAKIGQKSKPAKELDTTRSEKTKVESDLADERARSASSRSDLAKLQSTVRDLEEKSDKEKIRAKNLETELASEQQKVRELMNRPVAGDDAVSRMAVRMLLSKLAILAAEKKGVEDELKIAQKKASAPPEPVVVRSIPLDRLDQLAGNVIPDLNFANPAGVQLDVFGCTGGQSFVWDPASGSVTAKQDAVTLNFKPKGDRVEVSQAGGTPQKFQHGNLLLRVSKDGKPVEYVQFFRPPVFDSEPLNTNKFVKDKDGTLTTFRVDERRSGATGKVAGRNARVRIGDKSYDLDPTSSDPLLLESRPSVGASIRLRIEKDEIVVEVRGLEATNMKIEYLDIVRILDPVPEHRFPRFEQTLVRYHPFKK